MPLAHLEIVRVVRRRHLDRAGTELGVHELIGDDGDGAVKQRQPEGFSDKLAVAVIVGVHRDGRIAQHGLRACRGHRDVIRAFGQRVPNGPQLCLPLFMDHFQIADHRAAARAGIRHVAAAIDQPLAVEARKSLNHGLRVGRVHGEAQARPVAGGAGADHVIEDGAAALFLPLPAAFEKLFPPHGHAGFLPLAPPDDLGLLAGFEVRLQFAADFPLHNHLRGDAGVVGPRQPEHFAALHAAVAHEDVDLRMLEHVPHVERAGDVGRRDDERVALARCVIRDMENLPAAPQVGPFRLNGLRGIDFGKLAGQRNISLLGSVSVI